MSAMRPRGHLPARVYWVRRTLVLAVALGLVFGIAQLLGGSTGASDDEAARVVGADRTPTQSPQGQAATADDRPSQQAGPRGTKGRKPKKTKTPLAVPTGPCRNEEVVVEPKLKEAAYAGSLVHVRLKLTTTGNPACTWTVSPETLVVKITSGNDRIWSSQDCPDAVPQTDVVVRKDVPAKVDLGWAARRSDTGCTPQRGWAQPGFYHVATAAYGAEPTDVQFELRSPVAPTVTAKPKPEKDKGKGKKADEKKSDRPESGRQER
ncbi:hypothetical protein [Nocardioides iriomotensis]|uniref:DUF4232 domain-containing protein n=1 Tax=Nocardioides iriomotensis TaxID=715784 RepID=A0A4Q5J988_9ACTN|nr:hypothetical protein [Nocardioides iriomotensis]RYU14488.1 hypothetical protein ETU37_02865 [Nocardioides iriomotensis]